MPPHDNAPSVVSIAVLDVCEFFISGIASALAPYGFEVTVAAKQLFELQQSTTLLSRHVNALIIGPLFPAPESFEVCRWIRQKLPAIWIVFVTSNLNKPIFRTDAAFVGVSACLSMSVTAQELANTLRIVLNGYSLMNADIEFLKPISLSARETDVLQLLEKEKSNRAIADTLHIDLQTARTHVKHIIRKLRVNSRSDAVYRAKHLGWL
jgi:DNA-binding NarL/FixJ family response regulator